MKIIAINGSPRINWNTSTLLQKALDGAASKGAQTEIINLHQLNYKGCSSCFACKRKGSKSFSNCAMQDDLTQVLEKIKQADAIIFGSPIYFSDITGEMRSFLERLLFQYLSYDKDVYLTIGTYAPKKLKTAFIYTMGETETRMISQGYIERFKPIEDFISKTFGSSIEILYSNDAYQFDDYSKYAASVFDVEEKIKHKKEQFPVDIAKAFDLGIKLVSSHI